MAIKTFRGLLANNTERRINISTNKGDIGYRITKFEVMSRDPGDDTGSAGDYEHIVKIYSIPQTTITTVIDFEDQTLIAAAFIAGSKSAHSYPTSEVIVFDSMIFNQDIYISLLNQDKGDQCNYYIELEQFKLDLNESTVATLKDIRNIVG